MIEPPFQMDIGTESCYLAVHRENLHKDSERVLACYSSKEFLVGLFFERLICYRIIVMKKFCVVGINLIEDIESE